jgi:hypothetical protein
VVSQTGIFVARMNLQPLVKDPLATCDDSVVPLTELMVSCVIPDISQGSAPSKYYPSKYYQPSMKDLKWLLGLNECLL